MLPLVYVVSRNFQPAAFDRCHHVHAVLLELRDLRAAVDLPHVRPRSDSEVDQREGTLGDARRDVAENQDRNGNPASVELQRRVDEPFNVRFNCP